MSSRTLDDDLAAAARATSDAEALVTRDRHVSYAEFERLAGGLATGLRRAGVQRGDRVLVALPNDVDAAVALYGVLRAGAAIVPLNPTIKPDKLAYVASDAAAAALICAPDLPGADAVPVPLVVRTGDPFAELAATPPEPAAGALEVDLAAVLYTSGSTGLPKGVTLTHRNMTFAAGSIIEYLGLRADDRLLLASPLSFDYGLYQLLMAVRVGATLVLERRFAFPGRIVGLLDDERITVLPGVPTVFSVLVGLRGLAQRELPHLRLLTNTGAALSEATIAAIRGTFPGARLFSMYGLTECKRVSYLPPDQLDVRPTSVGIPIPGTEAWVADEAGRELPPGEVGELLVRGAHVMQGYWNDPQASAERLRPGRWPWERVLATGDLFCRDDEGFLYFVGRTDDMIKSRGEKVAPREVEEVLHAAPGVLEVAVVGVPDRLLGQAVHAHVTATRGRELDEADLRRYCVAHLEDHMVPQRIVVHAELPRTPNGKVDRKALAAGV